MEAGNLGEAPGRANRARLGLLRFPMPSLSSIAAHFGAAAAASLLAAAGLAFEAGRAGASETAPVLNIQPEDGAMLEAAAPVLSGPAAVLPAEAARPVTEAAPEAVPSRPMLAVIIDDVGLSRTAFDRLMSIDAPLTLAFLPYGEAAPAMAREAGAAGREVFLHLPMEPVGLDDPGPMAVTRHLDGAGYDVTTGIGPDLMTGAREAVMQMIELLAKRTGMTEVEAYMLASVAGDLRISEIVDAPNWVVSFYFPRVVLE
jgi:hypothetical protein